MAEGFSTFILGVIDLLADSLTMEQKIWYVCGGSEQDGCAMQ